MIKAFIFDMDGVIIDSEPRHFESVNLVMKEFGIDLHDYDLNDYIGMTNPKMWAELKEKYHLNVSLDKLLEMQFSYKKVLFTADKIQAIEGILKLLSDLKSKGILIGLASSSSRKFIELILKNLNIYDYFNAIVSGEEVTKSKPEPDVFLKTAQLLNVSPSNCIVLEDSCNGVRAAKSAGMKCIAFNNPNSGNQDLSSADLIVELLENLDYLAM